MLLANAWRDSRTALIVGGPGHRCTLASPLAPPPMGAAQSGRWPRESALRRSSHPARVGQAVARFVQFVERAWTQIRTRVLPAPPVQPPSARARRRRLWRV